MFGKLKAAVGDSATKKITTILEPHIGEVMEKMRQLSPKAISHNESYQSKVITPARLAILAASSGASKLLPKFDEKFERCMFHLRDELVDTSGEVIKFVPDFKAKLPETIKAGISLPIAEKTEQ